ncbi:MAG TPA: CRISPR-associated ring nuclease Csm6, partial [Candidatus Sumerlaeota bacterium]|nr:CRISPR-associated ring nuclease Csm6 [Candidatus Sumerlaeota bacterium]
LARLRRDYPARLKRLRFDEQADIRECPGPDGCPVGDIRSEADNRAVADWILSQAAEACGDDSTTVHASLAGGRKTMSFFLGAAMQLLARPQDRLYHVLVPEAYEVREFDYPAPRQRLIPGRDGRPIDAAQATVDMAEVPFVRLRGLFEREELSELAARVAFSDLVARAESAMGPAPLEIHVHWRAGRGEKIAIRFTDPAGDERHSLRYNKADTREFIFYTYLLHERRKDALLGREASPRPIPMYRTDALAETFLALLDWTTLITDDGTAAARRGSKMLKDLNSYLARLRKADSDEVYHEWQQNDISQRISRFNRDLTKAMAVAAPHISPRHFIIHGLGRGISAEQRGLMYVAADPARIHFHPELDT